MKSLLLRIWSTWANHTEVRHAATALVASLLVAAAPILTDWASASEQKWVGVVVVSALAAGARWAGQKLPKPAEPQEPAQ